VRGFAFSDAELAEQNLVRRKVAKYFVIHDAAQRVRG
jgi:hypothetical protein